MSQVPKKTKAVDAPKKTTRAPVGAANPAPSNPASEPVEKKKRAVKPAAPKQVDPSPKSDVAVKKEPAKPAKEAPKKPAEKAKAEKKKVEKAPEPTQENPEEQPSSEKPQRKKRKVINPETIQANFEVLKKLLEDEISKRVDKPEKVKGVRILRVLNKHVKNLHKDTVRVMKKMSKKRRKKGVAPERQVLSGFSKLCQITPQLARFMGCEDSERKSRVDATRAIVKYIKENELADKAKPKIIHPDSNLASLLRYDGKALDDEGNVIPLTYFYIQKLIQIHFIKEPKVPVVVADK